MFRGEISFAYVDGPARFVKFPGAGYLYFNVLGYRQSYHKLGQGTQQPKAQDPRFLSSGFRVYPEP